MVFVKYPKTLYITDYDRVADQIAHVNDWVITEKIDGTNFSIIADTKARSFEIGSRNRLLVGCDNFGLAKSKLMFIDVADRLIDAYHDQYDYIISYGEYFGPKVLQRIDYGRNCDWRLFALAGVKTIDGKVVETTPLPFVDLEKFVNTYDLCSRLVPVICHINDILTIDSVANDDISRLSPSNSIEEGIVAHPYMFGSDVRFKSKNEKYAERSNNVHRTSFAGDDDNYLEGLENYRKLFDSYCTLNRMISVFSKYGAPTDKSQTRQYLQWFVEDALEDFTNDNPQFIADLRGRDIKKFAKLGKVGYQLFLQAQSTLRSN